MNNRFKKNLCWPVILVSCLIPFMIAAFILEGFGSKIERRPFSMKEVGPNLLIALSIQLAFALVVILCFCLLGFIQKIYSI